MSNDNLPISQLLKMYLESYEAEHAALQAELEEANTQIGQLLASVATRDELLNSVPVEAMEAGADALDTEYCETVNDDYAKVKAEQRDAITYFLTKLDAHKAGAQ